jgi:2,3-bisphosphoglycerate-independent phosphoglycerate mutase
MVYEKEAIERIDEEVLGTILDDLDSYAEWRVLVLADHPTPIVKRTHTAEPAQFVLCGTGYRFLRCRGDGGILCQHLRHFY